MFHKGGRLRRSGLHLQSTPTYNPAEYRVATLDTGYVDTYPAFMNVTLSLDEQLVERARKKADALGKSLNQLVREYLQRLAGEDDAEGSVAEFKRLSGRGHSQGCRFDRNEIHERS